MKIITNKQGEVSIKGLYDYLKKYYNFFKRYLEKNYYIITADEYDLSDIKRKLLLKDQDHIFDVICELEDITLCMITHNKELSDYSLSVNIELSHSNNLFKLFDIWDDPNDFELVEYCIESTTEVSFYCIQPKTSKGEEILALFMLERDLGN